MISRWEPLSGGSASPAPCQFMQHQPTREDAGHPHDHGRDANPAVRTALAPTGTFLAVEVGDIVTAAWR